MDNLQSKAENYRKWERKPYSTRITVTFSPTRVVEGTTQNVSLDGVLLKTVPYEFRILKGDRGVLRMEKREEALEFPCEVIRAHRDTLVLNLFQKQAAFGLAVTQEILESIQGKG
ncbi:MAG: PilZ domain-containing protein [Magnetococcales bacterium]|nr:PilZ domain-containing protein [Magnetococcales bacterium]